MSTSQDGSEEDRRKSIAAPGLVEEHCKRRLIEAEFALVTSRLNEIDDFKRDPQGKANPYITDLVKRRDTLLKQLGAVASTGETIGRSPLEWMLAGIEPIFFGPWITVNLPFMGEGVNEISSVPGTSGQIYEAYLGRGIVWYSTEPPLALIDDGSSGQQYDKMWMRTWTCSYVFPDAPYSGFLFYRFNIAAQLNIYQATAQAGLVYAFASVGRTADADARSPFDPAVIRPVGSGLYFPLPVPNDTRDVVVIPVTGVVHVDTGKIPAVGMIYGVIVGVNHGLVILGGRDLIDICFFDTFTESQVPGRNRGKIDYFYATDAWVKELTDRYQSV